MRETRHTLKTHPRWFRAVWEGQKLFEVRRNDRGFCQGDHLELREYDPDTETYSGRRMLAGVSFVLYGPGMGVEDGYCVMSLDDLRRWTATTPESEARRPAPDEVLRERDCCGPVTCPNCGRRRILITVGYPCEFRCKCGILTRVEP